MSDKYYTLIRDVLIRSNKLTPHEKVVLFVILSYGDCKKIYLSQKRISTEANMSRDGTHKILKSLKEKGYIRTKEMPDRATLEYELLIGEVTDIERNPTDIERRGYGSGTEGGTAEERISIKSISIKKEKDKKQAKKNEIELPDWLNKEAWSSWVQHRKEKKKKLTPSSIKKQIAFLEENKTDHIDIINRSIMNGWQGLFELPNKPEKEKDYSDIEEMIDEARRNKRTPRNLC